MSNSLVEFRIIFVIFVCHLFIFVVVITCIILHDDQPDAFPIILLVTYGVVLDELCADLDDVAKEWSDLRRTP